MGTGFSRGCIVDTLCSAWLRTQKVPTNRINMYIYYGTLPTNDTGITGLNWSARRETSTYGGCGSQRNIGNIHGKQHF